jgi:dienelactone hydrolase
METTTPPPIPFPPDQTGPYAIGNVEFPFWTGGPGFTLAKISYPAQSEGGLTDVDQAEGGFPAVIVAPATWTGAGFFDWFSDHLVKHGYIVFRYTPENILGLNPHMHADTIKDAIDKLIDINDDRFNPLRGLVKTDSIGVAGASLGGAGALVAASRDKRIRAVVGLGAGRNDKEPDLYSLIDAEVQGVGVPTLLLSGQNDKIAPGAGVHYYDLVPKGYKALVEIAGGNHVQFLDPSSMDVKIPGLPRDGKATVTYAEQHATANLYATAFFDAALKGHADSELYISGEAGTIALKDGVVSDIRVTAGPIPAPAINPNLLIAPKEYLETFVNAGANAIGGLIGTVAAVLQKAAARLQGK